jgi:peptidoglycan/LPS O-acetylase OafA/YrhL
VVLVLIYHFFPDVMPGGFIGVDVFFVFSGFLITSLLVREFMDQGRVNISAFYARRIRRLLPALLAMLLLILPLSLLISADYRTQLAQQVAAALGWVTNFYEIAAGQSYADSLLPHLFTHTWTLGVEMQYYVVWALVLCIALPLLLEHLPSGKLSLNRARRVLVVVSGAVIVLSFVAMQLFVLAAEDPSAAYFSTLSHIYPLMIGSAVGLVAGYPHTAIVRLLEQIKPRFALAIVVFCLALIAALALTLNFENLLTYHIGILLTALATAVAILIGRGMQWRLVKVPELKVLNYLAEVSYSLYLLHWPIAIIFTAWASDLSSALDDAAAAALATFFALLGLALSFVLSHLSYTFIEKPFASGGRGVAAWRTFAKYNARTVRRSLGRTPQTSRVSKRRDDSAASSWAPPGTSAAALKEAAGPPPRFVALPKARRTMPRALRPQVVLSAGSLALVVLCVVALTTAPRASSMDEDLRLTSLEMAADQLNGTHQLLGSFAKVPILNKSGAATIGMDIAVTKKDSITVIGDSVTILPSKLIKKETGARIDAKVGRSMRDGLKMVKSLQDKGTLGTTVVIALATNTHEDSFESAQKICEALDPGRHLVFVTSYGVGKGNMAKFSAKLRTLASEYDFVTIADWAPEIAKHKKWLAKDGYHCDDQRSKELYATIVSDAIKVAQEGPVS